jgi:hypothetical protein
MPNSWESLADPDAPAPKNEPKLVELFAEIRETVAQEAQIIQAVFPHPAVVMQVFLQRVFAQVVRLRADHIARPLLCTDSDVCGATSVFCRFCFFIGFPSNA